ncbi:MAG: RNA polymerase sigma factor [bacterium]|nr:RNA polymerase sigma factor [bacterium]
MAEPTRTNKEIDAELVKRALAESEEFGRLIEKYQEPMRRYVRRIARPTPDELDILLQDIFIKVYENLNDFDQDLPFSSWIYRIAHNEAIDHLRRGKRFGASLDSPAYDSENLTLAETMPDGTDIASETDMQYQKKAIEALLDELEPKYRSVLVLKFLEERGYEEISDILRKPPGTVATLIHRAKKEFRRLADERGIDVKNI